MKATIEKTGIRVTAETVAEAYAMKYMTEDVNWDLLGTAKFPMVLDMSILDKEKKDATEKEV